MREFSEQLKDARKASGLTQQAMADTMLIPKRSLEKWETGERTPPEYVQRLVLEELARVAKDRKISEKPYNKKGNTHSIVAAILEKIGVDISSLEIASLGKGGGHDQLVILRGETIGEYNYSTKCLLLYGNQ